VEPIVVEVTRGEVVEARHVVHAAVVRDGRLELAAGDAGLVTFLRSSAKPIQALPVLRARPDLDDEKVALMCASHLAAPEQVAVVRRILADAPATEADLECGHDPTRVAHNCSGKHAGFLAVCRVRGWPIEGYRLADHPMQRLLLAEVAAAAEVPEGEVPTAVDGCGVLTFGLTLERMAYTFSRFAQLDGGPRIVGAMTAHPELIGYDRGATDTDLMRLRPGWIAKGGAEGLFCAASPEGEGIVLKVEDGSMRALRPAIATLLGLGEDFGRMPVENSRGEVVGEISA
jgi:L-asparaginase II